MPIVLDTLIKSDYDFVLRSFREWNLDCYGLQGEKPWTVMAQLACSGTEHLQSVVGRDGDRIAGFIIVVTSPALFWPAFLSKVGFSAVLGKVFKMLMYKKTQQPLPEEPVCEEFRQLALNTYTGTDGVASGLFAFIDPDYRKPPTALRIYMRMFSVLRAKGIEKMDGQIRFGNDASLNFHRALGFDIRNAGHCYHALKSLQE